MPEQMFLNRGKGQRGAAMLEYVLCAALIALTAMVAVKTSGVQTARTFHKSANVIQRASCGMPGC